MGRSIGVPCRSALCLASHETQNAFYERICCESYGVPLSTTQWAAEHVQRSAPAMTGYHDNNNRHVDKKATYKEVKGKVEKIKCGKKIVMGL